MTDPIMTDPSRSLEPVRIEETRAVVGGWTGYLIWFLRAMSGLAMMKGLYHWCFILGIGVRPDQVFEAHNTAWRVTTVFFAIINLVAAVGLWLAAPWGAVVWLTSIVSMIVVEFLFSQIFGGVGFLTLFEFTLLAAYIWLAIKAASEHPG